MTSRDSNRRISEEQLVAFLDNALPEAERKEVEEALRSDGDLAARRGDLERGLLGLGGGIKGLEALGPSQASLEADLAAAMARVDAEDSALREPAGAAQPPLSAPRSLARGAGPALGNDRARSPNPAGERGIPVGAAPSDQTRPDQTRPNQARSDQARPIPAVSGPTGADQPRPSLPRDRARAPAKPLTRRRKPIRPSVPLALLSASICAAFAIGVVIYPLAAGYLIPQGPSVEADPGEGPATVPPPAGVSGPQTRGMAQPRTWKRAVADYARLYDRNTVLNRTVRPSDLVASLAHVEAGLGIPLRGDALAVEGFELLDAELLTFEGRPLAKAIYRDSAGVPVLFCIMRSARTGQGTQAGPTIPPASGAIDGLNMVAWDKDGYGYIVIADTSPARVITLARGLLPRFF